MKPTKTTMLLLSACLIAALSLGAVSAGAGTPPTKSHMGHSPGSMELHAVMAKGPRMPMHMSGNVDTDFAMMMTMHHQQAIAMVDVLAKHGKSPELKAMALKMKAAQAEEIKQLARFAGPMDHGKMKMDHGKMAAAEFTNLDSNKDGKLTLGEITTANPLRAHFEMLDANRDGSLDRAEFGKHHGM